MKHHIDKITSSQPNKQLITYNQTSQLQEPNILFRSHKSQCPVFQIFKLKDANCKTSRQNN